MVYIVPRNEIKFLFADEHGCLVMMLYNADTLLYYLKVLKINWLTECIMTHMSSLA